MLKRLWQILGPVFCALLMVAALLFFYPINHKHNYTEEKKAAVSLNAEGFKSRTKKQEALSDPNHRFVPYFGSSEWLRFARTQGQYSCLCSFSAMVHQKGL